MSVSWLHESRAVHVRDFGAMPGDGRDHAASIQRAIEAALTSDRPVVEFDAGEYRVTQVTGRSPFNDRKVCLMVDGASSGFTLRGAVDAAGNPATVLIYDEPGPRFSVDYWLWVSRSKDVTIENLVLDFPGAHASGRITKIGNGRTWVELWPEVVKPQSFLQGAEYVFLYDPKSGEILREKITLGGGWDEASGLAIPPVARNAPYASLTDGHGFVLDAEVGEVGMGLVYPIQWHHAPEKTFVANRVENLTLRNLTIVTALGHVLLPVGCKNITVQKLRFDPGARGSHRGWSARRDGLTMRACRGNLLVEDSVFQAMSDDLLAFWGWQFQIAQILSPTKIVVSSRQNTGDYFLDFPPWIEPGDWIEFRQLQSPRSNPLTGQRCTIRSAEYVIDGNQRMTWQRFYADEIQKESWHVEYVLELNEPIPDFVADDPLKMALLGFTLFDSAVLRRVTTRNVTNHYGVLIPGALEHTIEDCVFGTAVNIAASPAIGSWHGGTGLWRAVIRNNTFTSSPIIRSRKGLRAEGVHTLQPRGEILIEGNTFLDGADLVLGGTQSVTLRDNTFVTSASEPPITIRGAASPEIRRENNRVEPREE